MNRTQMKGKLRQVRGELKKEWGKLTDDDMRRLDGEIDKLVGIFQERYGHTRGAASRELQRYLNRYEEGRGALADVAQDQYSNLQDQYNSLTGRKQQNRGVWLWLGAAALVAAVVAKVWADMSQQDTYTDTNPQ